MRPKYWMTRLWMYMVSLAGGRFSSLPSQTLAKGRVALTIQSHTLGSHKMCVFDNRNQPGWLRVGETLDVAL